MTEVVTQIFTPTIATTVASSPLVTVQDSDVAVATDTTEVSVEQLPGDTSVVVVEALGVFGYPPLSIVTDIANRTLSANDDIAQGDASGGMITYTLPDPAMNQSLWLTIKKVDSTVNPVRIDPTGANTLDGDPYLDLVAQHESVDVYSDGIQYRTF